MNTTHKITFLILLLLFGCSNTPKLDANKNATDLVILVHGFAKSGRVMKTFAYEFQNAGYQTCVLNYTSLGVSNNALTEQTGMQINSCLTQSENAQNVHFVGHSLGGLLIRHYLQEDHALIDEKRLGRVVMIGTPNHGSKVADHYAEKFWIHWLGEIPLSLTTSERAFSNKLNEPSYNVGVIAGTKGYQWTSKYFDERNDGLVSVDSAKLPLMDDYYEVSFSHHQLRSDPIVTSLVLSYITHGVFVKT
ncbi:alpha/beta fold hydrolase [Vibrio panuliri]|uniref:AB hydrolase-1 domain-containing protein n=1 Tax=Vibrio panuliri TaxID=1381081 RepID=A0A1Q9HQB2_9VIBR|nr:alpha/beta fold hydrolase [Vibrio panuliri]KAB1457944.1 alpha/beta fold hydrolase [Vibrio panuliri]OLQ93064.1 hypothetical protein BIY22_00810 [Vibrio panuliri]OLQ95643.1 hypothetical protein BIY20_06280 [Vibrio panuliri]